MANNRFLYYTASPQEHVKVSRRIKKGNDHSRGYIREIASVLYQEMGISTGKNIAFGDLITCYVEEGYPGLIDTTRRWTLYKGIENRFNSKNQRPPVYLPVITQRITVRTDDFKEFLSRNAHKILQGDPLEAPTPSIPKENA